MLFYASIGGGFKSISAEVGEGGEEGQWSLVYALTIPFLPGLLPRILHSLIAEFRKKGRIKFT